MTQPRRVAAVTLAQHVAYELGDYGEDCLGKQVGYRIGGESKPEELLTSAPLGSCFSCS